MHLTETCDEGASPNLITDVQTTVAPVTDWEMTVAIQEQLSARELKPAEHLVDTGYVTAEHLAHDQQNAIALLGPVMPDTTWQAREGKGFTASSFQLDWQAKQATCPQGKTSQFWWKEGDGVKIICAKADCAICPLRANCPTSARSGRMVKLHAQQAHQALQERRQEQTTSSFRQQYAKRSGIEGTISQAVRRTGLRRARYDGLAKVHVQHLCTAVAVNLVRLDAFFTQTAVGETRLSHFARLVHRLPPSTKKEAA